MTILAVLILGYLVFTLIEFVIGFNTLTNLSLQSALPASQLPSVSIIFTALNEEAEIEAAVLSLLNINYPKLEIIAINDRSQDNTAHILNALQQRFPQLHVYHLNDLPEGWFGKNHALYYGSQRATGDWLLFTDADVVMKPDAITKAISYVLAHQLDHLTICEHHLRRTFWLKILLLAHYITYSMSFKPWRIRYQWSKRSLGHGAFNLVNKQVYEKCGTHAEIALECLDDLKLGQLIKSKGYAQDTVDGRDYVEREWYQSLPQMIEGWEKNAFAFFEYRLWILGFSSIFALLFFISPILFAFFAHGGLRMISIMNVTLMLIISAYVCRQYRLPVRYAVFYPVAIFLLLYTIGNSVISVFRHKGVIWRGTHYPLDKLRQVREHRV